MYIFNAILPLEIVKDYTNSNDKQIREKSKGPSNELTTYYFKIIRTVSKKKYTF